MTALMSTFKTPVRIHKERTAILARVSNTLSWLPVNSLDGLDSRKIILRRNSPSGFGRVPRAQVTPNMAAILAILSTGWKNLSIAFVALSADELGLGFEDHAHSRSRTRIGREFDIGELDFLVIRVLVQFQ